MLRQIKRRTDIMGLLTAKERRTLKQLDTELLGKFENQYPHLKRRCDWRSSEVRSLVSSYGLDLLGLTKLEGIARKKGLFDIRIERRRWLDSDGERRTFTLARATSTDMYPMGTNYWVRDNAIIGARLIRSADRSERKKGKDLLISCLSFMSSVAQLKRFEKVIRSKDESFINNCDNWPHIFAAVADNLNTARHEGWSHKQDAWQILAWNVLEELEHGRLKLSELTLKNKRFLGLIVPFLAKVSFWQRENSGSWEEIAAVRTSVRAWDHRLIIRIAQLSNEKGFEFLNSSYARYKRYLTPKLNKFDLRGAVHSLSKEVSRVILRDLPFESPMYPRKDARFREEDASLIYLLQMDYIPFLAERLGKDRKWERKLEERILAGVLKLQDDRSGGIYRYQRDTYQRLGFFRHLTAAKLVGFYGTPAGNASANFAIRHRLVPKGRQAAWTHPLWQLAAWSARRFIATKDKSYKKLHNELFITGLKLITGRNEGSFDVDKAAKTRIIKIPAWRMPECYIADTTNSGVEMVFPSPHTPLNWATAEMMDAFWARRDLLISDLKRAD